MKKKLNKKYADIDKAYYLPVFGKYPIVLKKGKGSKVWDIEGNEYLDAFAGISVNALGHNHPGLVAAISKQAKQLIHVSNFFITEPQAELARQLCKLSGLDRAFFANSGAEAVEGSYKLARKYGYHKGKKSNIIYFSHCFHGRTLATITTGKKKYQQGFGPLPEGFVEAEFNNITDVAKKITSDTAAIIIEPIQGEGGIHIADKKFMQDLYHLCHKHDILLILDEVQCGMGRTGSLFAYEQYGIVPDIVTLAKGIAGGVPMGAILCTEKVASTITVGEHGTTFGGNPLACAAALATLRVLMQKKTLRKVQEKGEWLIAYLQKFAEKAPGIKEVRGMGLLIGVELTFAGKAIVDRMLAKGVLGNCTADTVIRFAPPLVSSKKELKKMSDIFFESFNECAQ